ncbi:AbrB/MazE/SpoVT family DNA-binding domain-containing protein [Nostoc sp.]|uniref:AbrB/MazE/SpoVT family DNA-binding domain-containing protein n=1 Tax=Nostoc sp. TaxID=1180 RepID=UPI002FF77382
MTTVVTKWGNSLAIRLPKALAEQVNVKEGTDITFSVSGNSIVITPQQRKKYTLDELLEGMTPDNFHPEIDTGSAVGNEVW